MEKGQCLSVLLGGAAAGATHAVEKFAVWLQEVQR